jgi:hypothetical protein
LDIRTEESGAQTKGAVSVPVNGLTEDAFIKAEMPESLVVSVFSDSIATAVMDVFRRKLTANRRITIFFPIFIAHHLTFF